jgi:hypothetical protein
VSRWLVVTTISSVISAGLGFPPAREFRYYRWRWLARFKAWADNNALPVPFMSIIQRAELVGRVSLKADATN